MYSADAREGFKVLAWRHSRIRSHAGTPKHVNIFGYFYEHRHRRFERGGE